MTRLHFVIYLAGLVDATEETVREKASDYVHGNVRAVDEIVGEALALRAVVRAVARPL